MYQGSFNLKFLPVIPVWISLFLIGCLSTCLSGQSKSELIANQKKLRSKIALTQRNIAALQKDKSISLRKWTALNQQIESRNSLLENLELEMDLILADIVAQEADIKLLKEKYDLNFKRFKALLKKYYRTRTSLPIIAFIFSSSNIYTAWKRLVFYQKLSRHYEFVEKDLSHKSNDLLQRLADLEVTRSEKNSHLERYKKEQNELGRAEAFQKTELQRLRNNEALLKQQLSEQETENQALSTMLSKIVNRTINEKRSSSTLPSAARKLNNAFGANKGRLPWPVAKGYIAKKFGKQRHPQLKMIFINNNGIDIVSEPNAEIQSVFEGSVIAIQSVAGFQKTILINHGTYYTVYANVENVIVSKGDKVKTGQTIAYLGSQDDQSLLHFELWKVKTLQNPTTWLKPR